jgi:hypothetical protein
VCAIFHPEGRGGKNKEHLTMLNLNRTLLNLDKSVIGVTFAKIAANIEMSPNDWLGMGIHLS